MALYAFDGTWNFKDSKDPLNRPSPARYGPDVSAGRDTSETNVQRFAEFYGKAGSKYIEGVGTRWWWVGRIFGGGFGAGGKKRIREMYRALMYRYHGRFPDSPDEDKDREIDIVGFSRGAALAVHFANVVARHGVRNPHGELTRLPRYSRDFGFYRRLPKERVRPGTRIDFLGLWDTVASFGIPIKPFRNGGSTWSFRTIPPNVERCFHALALDEVRATFETLLFDPDDEDDHIYELWFRGVHANVGGGYVDRGLSDIALAWMMEQAVWTWSGLGRSIPPRFIEALAALEGSPPPPADWRGTNLESLVPDPNGLLGRPQDLRWQRARELGPVPKVHHSVLLRNRNLISDHRAAGRRLLRRTPGDAQIVYDPPIFYTDSIVEALRELAMTTFARVTVNPRDWLKIGGHYVFRSDNWIGYGPKESRPKESKHLRRGKITREEFLQIAMAWFVAERPRDARTFEVDLPEKLGDPKQTADDVKGWVVQVLVQMERYLPRTELSNWCGIE